MRRARCWLFYARCCCCLECADSASAGSIKCVCDSCGRGRRCCCCCTHLSWLNLLSLETTSEQVVIYCIRKVSQLLIFLLLLICRNALSFTHADSIQLIQQYLFKSSQHTWVEFVFLLYADVCHNNTRRAECVICCDWILFACLTNSASLMMLTTRNEICFVAYSALTCVCVLPLVLLCAVAVFAFDWRWCRLILIELVLDFQSTYSLCLLQFELTNWLIIYSFVDSTWSKRGQKVSDKDRQREREREKEGSLLFMLSERESSWHKRTHTHIFNGVNLFVCVWAAIYASFSRQFTR